MDKLSINIKIENRNYPMKINVSDEENLRLAGKLINDKIRTYRGHFHKSDTQDLLSMVAIEVVSENLKLKKGTNSNDTELSEVLDNLNQKIDNYLAS